MDCVTPLREDFWWDPTILFQDDRVLDTEQIGRRSATTCFFHSANHLLPGYRPVRTCVEYGFVNSVLLYGESCPGHREISTWIGHRSANIVLFHSGNHSLPGYKVSLPGY
jgi:hypothetical protein